MRSGKTGTGKTGTDHEISWDIPSEPPAARDMRIVPPGMLPARQRPANSPFRIHHRLVGWMDRRLLPIGCPLLVAAACGFSLAPVTANGVHRPLSRLQAATGCCGLQRRTFVTGITHFDTKVRWHRMATLAALRSPLLTGALTGPGACGAHPQPSRSPSPVSARRFPCRSLRTGLKSLSVHIRPSFHRGLRKADVSLQNASDSSALIPGFRGPSRQAASGC
jgi:hypothetical protein